MRVLFIDIDTLRPDHLGCYGYSRETSPNIDSVCADGVRFDNYYCSDAPCLPSRAALIRGKFGIRSGNVGHGGSAAEYYPTGESRGFRDAADTHNFNNIFRRAGLHTASVSTFAERHSAWWFNAGFNECVNVGKCGHESGEEVLPAALSWLSRNAGRDDWFLHVHFWDPHTPYRAPAEFGNPFENEPLDTWIDDETFALHKAHTGPHSINELNMYDDEQDPLYPRMPGRADTMEELKKVIDGYDCGVAFADSLVGKITDELKRRGIYDETAIIITSDHGENLGELGIYSEHGTADAATCRIPFIIKWPGAKSGITAPGLHYSLDLLPTLCELLGLEAYPEWDGQSYASALTSGDDPGRQSLVISQMCHVCQRSAVFDGWLYTRTYHCGYHLFDAEMLFNLKSDPHERHDLKEQYPEICARGAKIILDWHDDAMKRSQSPADPLWTVMREQPYHAKTGLLEDYLIRLEKTGRAEGAEKLRKRYMK